MPNLQESTVIFWNRETVTAMAMSNRACALLLLLLPVAVLLL